ncbi:MAG TPA: DPP IV N-terminal domain-containing protein [Candidatus Acidoferrum sp.]|nr:DPP IV N-terminal domain-containing protein [Candidatus Acidoferrum sp.]
MKTTTQLARFIVLIPLFACSIPAKGQGTLVDYQRAARYLTGDLERMVQPADIRPSWIEGTDNFWYLKPGRDTEFVTVDAEKNTVSPAFDQTKLAEDLSKQMGRSIRANHLPFRTFEFVQKNEAIRFVAEDQRWTCELSSYRCTKEKLPSVYESVSPDGNWAAFTKDYNLYLRNLSTGAVSQLTTDGVKSFDYATPLPSSDLLVREGSEDAKEPPAVFWSPDSNKLVTYRLDSRNAGRFTTIQFVPPAQLRPKAFTYVYPLPGEVMPTAEPIIFDVHSLKRTEIQTAPIEIYFQGGPFFSWYQDSERIHYTFHARGYKSLEFREVNASTGSQHSILEEDAKTYIDPGESRIELVNDGAELLLTSERDGWNHIYLYNGKTGALENQVTKGPWPVRNIVHVDEKNRQIYFLAGGREKGVDPYLTQLYRVNFDGSGMQSLTPGGTNHTVSVSPDSKFFVDNSSRADLPGDSTLRRTSDGSEVRVLDKADASALLKTGWKLPEPFQGVAADGKTDIYGLIWRPSNFDPSKKYPIIEQIYTGPQGFFVPKTFGAANAGRRGLQSMAELGFIVVMVDGRGTTGRSRAFHEYSYHNLGGVFDDHVALIKQMGAKYPYMDLDRVGIYGTSAGGYGSAHAILVHPEFYKVCVSISGDHDARLDKAWWNELYQGYPVGKDYAEQSNVTLAGQLQGHLLLVHGDVDNNVNPVETMRLVDALIKANKNFDMLLVPNMYHGEGRNLYLVRRRWDYFVQNLLGVTPPKNFKIESAPSEDSNGN